MHRSEEADHLLEGIGPPALPPRVDTRGRTNVKSGAAKVSGAKRGRGLKRKAVPKHPHHNAHQPLPFAACAHKLPRLAMKFGITPLEDG